MTHERRLEIRSAFNNDLKRPFMKVVIGPYASFALVKVNGKTKAVPGASLASATLNGIAYLRRLS